MLYEDDSMTPIFSEMIETVGDFLWVLGLASRLKV
jgi:hypothetical protein